MSRPWSRFLSSVSGGQSSSSLVLDVRTESRTRTRTSTKDEYEDRWPMGRVVSWAAILLPAFLLASGCATKAPPPSEEIQRQALPGLVLTNGWKAGTSAAGGVEDDWLARFRDDQLTNLVAEALTNNLDLRVAGARVEQAAAYVDAARAALRPMVGVAGTGGLKAGGSDVSSALQGIMLAASWEPDLWGRIRYVRNAAQATYASAELDLEFARQSLAATVARTWFTASETWMQTRIADEMVRAAEDLSRIAGDRRRVGAGSEQDVALAQATVARFQDSAKQAAFAHEQTLRALELLLGRYPATELAARRELPPLPGPVPVGLPLDILERRPDLRAAERRVAAAFHRIGEARTAFLPRLTLNASVSAISSEVIQLKDDFSNPVGGAGAKLLAPIYTGGGLRAQVAVRTAEQKEAVAEYGRMALRAVGDVENALASGASLAGREAILRRGLEENRRALRLVNESYRVGQADLRAVQQQLLDVNSAQLTLLRVQGEALSQRVNLHLALGGGFAVRPPPPPEKP
jgi:outer membrane protein, multidrug efflux system